MADDPEPPPPTIASLIGLARAHLARRAMSRQELQATLLRRIARTEGAEPPAGDADLVAAAIDRVARAGWIDEAALADARASDLVRQGWPADRIRERLAHQGIDPDAIPATLLPEDEVQARRYAERKRLGPFASGRRVASPDRDLRAMVRAGFDIRLAERVLRRPAGDPPDRGGLP